MVRINRAIAATLIVSVLTGSLASGQTRTQGKPPKSAKLVQTDQPGLTSKIDRHIDRIQKMISDQKFTLAMIEIQHLESTVRQAQTVAIEAAFPTISAGYGFRDTSSDDTEYTVFSRAYTDQKTGSSFDVTLLVGDPYQEEIAQLANGSQDQSDVADTFKTVVLKNGVIAVERNGDSGNTYERSILVSDSIMIRIEGDASTRTQIDRFCDLIDFLKLQRGIERR